MRPLAIAAALAATACGADSSRDPRFQHLEYDPIGGVPTGAMLQPRLVTLPVGATVAARVFAVNDRGFLMACDPTVTSDDESVMRIEQADRGSTVFTGVSSGSATILVHCGLDDGTIAGRTF